MAAQQVEMLRQRHDADVRYNVAMQRLVNGQSHNQALLQQLAASEAAAEEEAKAHAHVTGASDDTTKRQRTLAADLTHHLLPDGTRRTLCIGLSCMSRGTAASKAEHFEKRMKAVQAAAKLSVPTFHGAVEAFDRVTLGHLITCWDVEAPLEVAHRREDQELARVQAQAKLQLEGADGAALAQMAPWDRLIYEVAKLLCMNARKMNVAIGQDLHERTARDRARVGAAACMG